ncbi:aldehyde dehydrogenase family protein [Stackebrandtia soli]|uniref:aldehyde dehydrogenase family protein n=1 Tax=Stackebrandtia soli TaxID=1892856 RepID=UPI0039EC2874
MQTVTAPQIIDGQLVSVRPATGEEVGRHPVADSETVAATVATARETAAWWAGLDWSRRRAILLACKKAMAADVRGLMTVLRAETGKSVSDAFSEISTCFEHADWAPKNAARVLRRRRVRTNLSLIDHASYLEYHPYGVVAVIGPWNYPLHTPMGSIVYALAAGNTVVFKPSEYTPGVGQWIADTINRVAGRPLVGIVHGLGDVGALLCQADVDKIAFTGSVPTARKVATAAASRLIPALIEGGGKDAAIVAADADVVTAAGYVAWGAFTNAGQSCTGFERVYVVESIADRFIDALVAQSRDLRVGSDDEAQIGPITMPKQLDIIASHIDAAVADGGTCVLGGPGTVEPPFVSPTIIVDVPESSVAVTEETFGPVLIVNRVPDVDEAVRRTNATPYGLGGAVFGKRNVLDIASRVRSGMTAINSGFAFAAIPALPFGGVRDSGYGRAHGADGLREFAVAKSIARRRLPAPLPLMSLKRAAKHNKLLEWWISR